MLFALALLCTPAVAQNPVPLPTDPSLAAYVGISGNFRSTNTGELRYLEMAADMAAYTHFEQPDPATMDSRLVTELTVPDEANWGLFDCADAILTLKVKVTDANNRLGSATVYEYSTGRLVGSIPASPEGGQILGMLQNDQAVRLYLIRLLSRDGTLLCTLLARPDGFDQVVWFQVGGGFQPYRPATIKCNGHPPGIPPYGDDNLPGEVGNPKTADPTQPLLNVMGYAEGCCLASYANDSSQALNVYPPGIFTQLKKREVILDTVTRGMGQYKMSVESRQGLSNLITAVYNMQDQASALNAQIGPPYSTGCPHWHVKLSGIATSVIAIPFKRKASANWLNVLLGGAVTLLTNEKKTLSSFLTGAFNQLLQVQANQQQTGLKPGDVIQFGDIYSLLAENAPIQIAHLQGITETVTFTLQPDIPPPSGSGSASLTGQGAWTTPAPPVPQSGANLLFSSGSNPAWTTTMQLPKGFKWSISGNIASPPGYQAGPATQFQTPVSGPVSIPCTLTVLLQLRVYTVSAANPSGPMSIRVQALNASNAIVAEGDSVVQPDGRCAFSVPFLTPGVYTLKASRVTSGGSWSGTATVQVQRGVLQETTLTVTYTPAPPR
jgi:hypothetical protein